jgi:anti-sigma factor RsiW
MTDCPKGEIRDQLPDFLHDQLAPTARAAVAAHVASCAACSRELELLRRLRGAMRAAPNIDVARIVAALPRSSRAETRRASEQRADWRRLDWRIAAAIVTIAVGGGAAAILSGGSRDAKAPQTIAQAPLAGAQVGAPSVSIEAYVGEASATELEALLDDLESFDGLPAGEPDPSVATGDAEEGL